ncbi:MAG: hypothetical protein PHT94_00970 [Candidatus Nanoarchaeia archaeon]|nr:hypothetical protein [Candidatus Nanoarchaeia archaeon]
MTSANYEMCTDPLDMENSEILGDGEDIYTEEEIEELNKKEKEAAFSEYFNKLNNIPISDDFKHKLIEVVLMLLNKGHSGSSYDYTVSRILYYLYKNISLEKIKTDLPEYYKEDADSFERTIAENIIDVIEKFRSYFNNPQYSMFFIDLLQKLFYHNPINKYITFEDDKWGENTFNLDKSVKHSLYQHKESSDVFKEVDEDGKINIFQIGYFIFEDEDGYTYTNGNSIIDLNDYDYWHPHSILVTKDIVQRLINEYRSHNVLFN